MLDYGIDSDTCTNYKIKATLRGNNLENYLDNWYYRWQNGEAHVVYPSPQARLKQILQDRQAPLVITSRKGLGQTTDIREMRARETLRRVLGEDKFRRFIKHGFVSVRAKSGLVYQIFPAHGITNWLALADAA